MSDDEQHVEPQPEAIRCDFCGEATTSVRRVALDRDYERLRTPHQERYACSACSEKKERERLGLDSLDRKLDSPHRKLDSPHRKLDSPHRKLGRGGPDRG